SLSFCQIVELFLIRRGARRRHIADELHIATERNRCQAPACSILRRIAEQFRPKADRKGFYADPAQATGQIVAHLMDKDDDEQDEKEGHKRAQKEASETG